MTINRFELIGKIVAELSYQDEATLQTILSMCEEELTDENIEVITYGKDDTEHILASPKDKAYLDEMVKKYAQYEKVMPEYAT